MKTLKKIESAKVDLTPNAKLSPEDMQNLTGGAGCICFNRKFIIIICPENGGGPICACDNNAFGLCNVVNGCTWENNYNGPQVVVDHIDTSYDRP